KSKKPSTQPPARAQQANHSSPKVDTNKSSKKRALSPSPPSNGASSSPSTSRGATPSKKPKKARRTKPFNKLFEGVVFAMSGYENPQRGQIRDKAVEMGARYKADWDRTCTHLLCAFINTPKFRQVKSGGIGKIVKKDWVECSYRDRCRYPWRRHCVDRSDKGVESDEEIYAEDDNDAVEEMVVDEEVPVEIDTKKDDEQANGKPKKKRILVMDSDDSDNDSKKAYEVDTDIDEDKTPDMSPSVLDSADTSDLPLPVFENLEFYICPYDETISDSKEEMEKLKELIVKRKGKVHKTPISDVEYYVCHSFDWTEEYSDALSDNPNLTFVHEKWIFECDKKDKLTDKDGYVLLPS
ncbi:DNA repair protein XRCC1, partial [Orchesella cincta]